MKLRKSLILSLIFFLIIFSALQLTTKELPLKKFEAASIEFASLKFKTKVFAPLYKTVYLGPGQENSRAISSLIIRNNSQTKNLYVNKIDTYNAKGEFQKHLIEHTFLVHPSSTLDFELVHQDDPNIGISGVILEIGSDKTLSDHSDYQVSILQGASKDGNTITTEGITIQDTGYGSYPWESF